MKRALTFLAALLLAPLAALPAADLPKPAPKPNIVFIFTDDQRFDTIAALGNPVIKTPNLDRLVRSGVSFRNHYIMGGTWGAVCVPSRNMMLTGRTLFRIAPPDEPTPATYSGGIVPPGHITLPGHMRQQGYLIVDGLTLENHGRDGVHVDGPASDGVIRNVSGDSHDDPVSLTAWDWRQYSASFGPIHHLTIEHITGAPEGKRSTDAIRLLPGIKRFSDGTTLDCPIHDITLRHITDIRDFKLYDQPNLEAGRTNDFSAGIGTLKNIVFENLTFSRPGSIQVHANTDGLTLRGAKLHFTPPADYHLVELGPKSATYKGAAGTDPAKWTEILSPDLDCTVRNVSITGVRTRDSQTDLLIEQVVKVIVQKPNPDYPKTTPKGGTGKGIWIR